MKLYTFNRKESSPIFEVLKIPEAIEFCGFYPHSLVDRILSLKTSYIIDKKKNLSSSILQTELSLTQKEETIPIGQV